MFIKYKLPFSDEKKKMTKKISKFQNLLKSHICYLK